MASNDTSNPLVDPEWDKATFPHANFPPDVDYTDKEKNAINFHLALAFKLCRLLEYAPYRGVCEQLTTIILFLQDHLTAALDPWCVNLKSFTKDLLELESVFGDVYNNLTEQEIRFTADYIIQEYDLLTRNDEQVSKALLRAVQFLGLSNIIASPSMYPRIREEFLRQTCERWNKSPNTYSSPPSPALSTDSTAFSETHPNAASKRPVSSTQPHDSTSDDFQLPKKFAKIKTYNIPPTTTSNTYEPLLAMETNATLPPENSNSEKPSENLIAPPPPNAASSEDKPQPIFLKQVPEYRDILNKIFALSSEKLLKKAIDDTIRLTPSSITHYRTIQKFLSDNNIQFYAMRPKSERPKKIIIRGLPTDTDIDELKTELTNLGFEVHRISPMRNFRTKIAYPNYIVDLYKNDALPGVFQLGNIMGYQVSVTNFVSTHPKQCFNCQRWGHSSDICSFSTVCLKCSGPHLSRTCSVPREKICCANCSQNHCSNYSKCPKNPKFIKDSKIAAEKEATISKMSSFPANQSSVRPGINFATATIRSFRPRTQPQAHQTTQSAPINNEINFPQLGKPATSSTTPAPNYSNTELDTTISKLERIRDLLLQIKTLSLEVNAIPGLNGLLHSVLGP